MTFMEALASGRPMRRRGTLLPHLWLKLTDDERPRFVVGFPSDSGVSATVGIARADYMADDWEIQPEETP